MSTTDHYVMYFVWPTGKLSYHYENTVKDQCEIGVLTFPRRLVAGNVSTISTTYYGAVEQNMCDVILDFR